MGIGNALPYTGMGSLIHLQEWFWHRIFFLFWYWTGPTDRMLDTGQSGIPRCKKSLLENDFKQIHKGQYFIFKFNK